MTRIMVVDDTSEICDIFKIGLEDLGYSVDTFTDPKEALASFRPNRYDFLLIDIKMPKMNGFELYKKIIEIENVKTCFITAFEINRKELMETFPDLCQKFCFVHKPVTAEEVEARMKEMGLSKSSL